MLRVECEPGDAKMVRGHTLSVMLLGLGLGVAAAPASDARWTWNKDCDEVDRGGGGDHEEEHTLEEPKSGLQLDPLAPPQYVKHLESPEHVVFQVTAFNDSWRSQAASLVVVLCSSTTVCIEYATDLGEWAPLWALAPSERRAALVWTEEEVPMGMHTVSIALLDDVGIVVDRYHGVPIQVGLASVNISKVKVGTRQATPRRSGRVRALDATAGLPLAVEVVNEGNAPEYVSAAFVLDGGNERSCGRELYTDAQMVEPGDTTVLTTFWADDIGLPQIEAGRHILTVLLYNSRDALVDERRGIGIKVATVER